MRIRYEALIQEHLKEQHFTEADRKELQEQIDQIRRLKKQVVVGVSHNYAHNIIGWTLLAIANKYGKELANQILRDEGLKKLGWREEK